MRHPIDALILLVLFALLAVFMHAQTTVSSARSMREDEGLRHGTMSDPQGARTKFDLLFSEPEFLR